MWQRRIIKIKFWLQRTYSYIGIINGIALIYLVLGRLVDKNILPKTAEKLFIPLCGIILVLFVIIGWLEDKLGLAGEEHRLTAEKMGLRK